MTVGTYGALPPPLPGTYGDGTTVAVAVTYVPGGGVVVAVATYGADVADGTYGCVDCPPGTYGAEGADAALGTYGAEGALGT